MNGDAIDQHFARIDRAANNGTLTPYWYLTDYQGSTTNLVTNAGQILTTVTYDAFGNFHQLFLVPYADLLGRYAWTGREFDFETGLQYNHARYYDPKAGRWISQDPMGFDAGDSNLYRYVNNRPTGGTDPSGLASPDYLQSLQKMSPSELKQEYSALSDRYSTAHPSYASSISDQIDAVKRELNFRSMIDFTKNNESATLKNGLKVSLVQNNFGEGIFAIYFVEKVAPRYTYIPLEDVNQWSRGDSSFPALPFLPQRPLKQIVIDGGPDPRIIKNPLKVTNWGQGQSLDRIAQFNDDNFDTTNSWTHYFGYQAEWIPLWRTAIQLNDGSYVWAAFYFANDVFDVLTAKAALSGINAAVRSGSASQAMSGATYLTSFERVERYEAILQRAISSGRTGERIGELGTRIEMMRRGYLLEGSGIFNNSGHGIDAVYRSVTSGEIAVVESKFVNGFKATWNAETQLGRGYGFRQMDDGWILRNIENAVNSNIPAAQRVGAFLEANGYTQRIIVVTNQHGEIFFHLMR